MQSIWVQDRDETDQRYPTERRQVSLKVTRLGDIYSPGARNHSTDVNVSHAYRKQRFKTEIREGLDEMKHTTRDCECPVSAKRNVEREPMEDEIESIQPQWREPCGTRTHA